MIATLRHRGPDDHGLFTDGPAALGAARLSIIDVAGGHQPISIDGGAITVAQNGEIYNYVELRDELERAGRRIRDRVRHRSDRASLRGRGHRRLSRRCAACSPWRSGTRRGSGWCWRAIASARSRSTTIEQQRRAAVRVGDQGDSRGARPTCRPSTPAALLDFFTFGYVAGEQARSSRACSRLEPGTALIVDARTGTRDARAFWSWPDAPRATTRCPKREAIERAARRADRGGPHPPALGRAARRVPQRRHGLGRGARADDAAVVAAGARPSRSASAIPPTTSSPTRAATAAALRRRSSRADRHARLRPRRRDAGRITTTSRSPTPRRFRPSTSPSWRGGT